MNTIYSYVKVYSRTYTQIWYTLKYIFYKSVGDNYHVMCSASIINDSKINDSFFYFSVKHKE